MAKSDKIVIPMDKEEAVEGVRVRLPEGDYIGKIVKVTSGTSEEKGTPYLGIKLKIVEGKYEGKVISDRLYLSPKALGRVRQLLEILGVQVPKKRFAIDKKKLLGKEIGFSLEDDEFTRTNEKGQERRSVTSRVSFEFLEADFVREGGVADEDDEDEDLDEDVEDDDEDTDEVDVDDDDDEDEM